MLHSQTARVRSLAADATDSTRQMQRAAAAGKESLLEAATRPSSLIGGALVAGSLIWLWPRRRSDLRITDHVAAAAKFGALVWHFARPQRNGGAASAPRTLPADAHSSDPAGQ